MERKAVLLAGQAGAEGTPTTQTRKEFWKKNRQDSLETIWRKRQ